MKVYGDVYKKSGISHYLIEEDQIKIKFKNGKGYIYTNARAGKIHVDKMKSFAVLGNGLNAYVNNHVRYLYSSKF